MNSAWGWNWLDFSLCSIHRRGTSYLRPVFPSSFPNLLTAHLFTHGTLNSGKKKKRCLKHTAARPPLEIDLPKDNISKWKYRDISSEGVGQLGFQRKRQEEAGGFQTRGKKTLRLKPPQNSLSFPRVVSVKTPHT